MATNKRKDAAALFELLDNSTLRVPKNAGSLKIPSWWTSKTNPSPERVDTTLEHGDVALADDAPTAPVVRTVVASVPDEPVALPLHSRMYEPPRGRQTPAAAPSIRPPAAATEAMPVAASSAPVEAAAAAPEEPESVAPREPRIFAPQTYTERRKQWLSPSPGAFARLPKWVLPVGAAAVFLIILGIVAAAHHRDNKATAAPTGGHPTPADAARAASATSALSGPTVASEYTPVPVPRSDQPARAFGPGEVTRTPDLYYVIITETPSKTTAEKNAQFLASKGIDVSTEIENRSGMYVLISVQGFPTISAAKPYKDRIIEVGHLTPEYKKGRGGWDSATTQNGLKMVAH